MPTTITAHAAPGGDIELEISIGEDRVEYVRLPVAVTWSERRYGLREFPGVDTSAVCLGEARYAYAAPAEETAPALVARLQTLGVMPSESELLAVWRDDGGDYSLWEAEGDAWASYAAED